MITQIFYISDVALGLNQQAVHSILAASRLNNWRLDITGLLMCSGRHFAQVVEGRREAVEQLIQKLGVDPRHSKMRVLWEGTSSIRRYGDWSMGYLHNERVTDELDRLGAQDRVSAQDASEMLCALRPDTVIGSL